MDPRRARWPTEYIEQGEVAVKSEAQRDIEELSDRIMQLYELANVNIVCTTTRDIHGDIIDVEFSPPKMLTKERIV